MRLRYFVVALILTLAMVFDLMIGRRPTPRPGIVGYPPASRSATR